MRVLPAIHFHKMELSRCHIQDTHSRTINRILYELLKTRKANCVLYKFSAADPFLKTLIKTLIPVQIFSLSYPHISHSGIVHCTSRIFSISKTIYNRFCSLFSHSVSSQSPFVNSILSARLIMHTLLQVIVTCMDIIITDTILINPRRACVTRVTYYLICVSVCLCVYRV